MSLKYIICFSQKKTVKNTQIAFSAVFFVLLAVLFHSNVLFAQENTKNYAKKGSKDFYLNSDYPTWWLKNDKEVQQYIQSVANKKNVKLFSKSSGGRIISIATYGEPELELKGLANFSSALKSKNENVYFRKNERKRPVLFIIGGIHGSESEGVMNALNYISIIETGKNILGEDKSALKEKLQKLYLMIIPLANPDGMSRYPYVSNVGVKRVERESWGQGTDVNGKFISGNKEGALTHPRKTTKNGVIGSYYDDKGINLMHDNFFQPMSPVTADLLKLVSDQGTDLVLNLHSHPGNPSIYETRYIPLETKQQMYEIANYVYSDLKKANITPEESVPTLSMTNMEGKNIITKGSFNLNSAFFHAGATIPFTFEFPDGSIEMKTKYDHKAILKIGEVLIESCADYLLKQ